MYVDKEVAKLIREMEAKKQRAVQGKLLFDCEKVEVCS